MRSFVIATVLAVAGAGLPSTASAAPPDDERVVTQTEFRRVHPGMRMKRVAEVFDAWGYQREYDKGVPGQPASQLRTYLAPDGSRDVWVYFDRIKGKWRVDVKFDNGTYDV